MVTVNGAEVVAVLGEAEIPAMPDLFVVRGWDPGAREWRWTVCEELEPDAATGRARIRPGTAEEAKALAVSRMEECGWQKVSVHRTSAPVEGTGLDAAWEKIEAIERGMWAESMGAGGRKEWLSPRAEIFYATKEEMRSQYAALKARVKSRLPGQVSLRYSHQVLGEGKVRMRCWLSRPAAGSTKSQAPNSK